MPDNETKPYLPDCRRVKILACDDHPSAVGKTGVIVTSRGEEDRRYRVKYDTSAYAWCYLYREQMEDTGIDEVPAASPARPRTTAERLRDDLREAYGQLKDATREAFTAQTDASEAQRTLKARKAEILLAVTDPKALGSNEAQREAKLAELTAAESTAATDAERLNREAQHNLGIAQIDAQASLAQLRVAELGKA